MNRAPLTREQRDLIRAALDQRVRRRIAAARDTGCRGCGGNLDNQTDGCVACWERHRYRKRHRDPVLREIDNQRRNQARRRQRARRKAA